MPTVSSPRIDCHRCGVTRLARNMTTVDNHKYCQGCFSILFVRCRDCGEIVERTEASSFDGHWYCEDCFSDVFTTCHHCGLPVHIIDGSRYIHQNEAGEEETQYYCDGCYSNEIRRCCQCDRPTILRSMRTTPYGDLYCRSCWDEHCRICDACGSTMWDMNTRWFGDEARCYACSAESDEWDQKEFQCDSPTYIHIPTRRKFGVEIETSRCDSHWELWGNTLWGCEYDCSVSGKEFISPPLYGDQGLDSILDFCGEAEGRGWEVDDRCGLHIHFDMSDLEEKQLFSLAYAYRQTWSLWKCFVSPRRGGYDMCGSPRYTTQDIKCANSWEYFVGARDRFEYVNWRSYFKHGTFEIRIGEPTLCGHDIVNWIRAHALFIEYTKDMPFDDLDKAFATGESPTRCFSFCAKVIWNKQPDLIPQLRILSRRHHNRSIQIRRYTDHERFITP